MKLHAIEQTQSQEQHCVDAIERGDAATASTRALLARYRAKRVARMEALAAGGGASSE